MLTNTELIFPQTLLFKSTVTRTSNTNNKRNTIQMIVKNVRIQNPKVTNTFIL